MTALTTESLSLLLALARDAANWSGVPPTDGNVGVSKEERGNLTDLKRKKLISTFTDDGETWVVFTERGKEFVAEHDSTITL